MMDLRNVFLVLLVTIIPTGLTEKNYLSKTSSNGDSHKDAEKLIKVTTVCNRDQLKLNINLNKPFKGVVFAKDFSEECFIRGNLTSAINLNLPTSGCGVRNQPQADGKIEISVKIIIQMDGKLRQSADIIKLVKCVMPSDMMAMNIMMERNKINPSITSSQFGSKVEDKKNFRNGRMKFDQEDDLTEIPNTTLQPSRVRVWLELGGTDGKDSVEVGQATTLGVRILLPRNIGVRIIDCAALDGLGESSQKLLDDRGCPIDDQVMPALLTRLRSIEEGWSKPHEDDLVERLFLTTFPAFKFPDRERLHISCGVQLCRGKCPNINCLRPDEQFFLTQEKQLARIEVFNSLAVTAPQIEIDRISMEKRYNVSVDEVSPRVRSLKSEGTLCLSTSKLALAFCTLGLIFLIAIIVALCCLLRARSINRSNNSMRLSGNTSIFSSSSGSQSRFGSKLLIPYPSGTLPYGRVY